MRRTSRVFVTDIFLTTRVRERAAREHLWQMNPTPVGHKLGWIQLTHVCRHWRQLALGFHSLWAEIDFARKELWVAELFHRAGPSALLSIYVSRPPTPSQSRLVQDSLPRIKFLRIECWSATEAIQPYLSLVDSLRITAPHLETFEVHDHNTKTGTFLYPDGLFGNATPKLRHFVAHSVGNAPWTLPYLCNLTSLCIWVFQDHVIPEVQMEDVLSALERMPALQELDLWQGLPERPPPAYGCKIVPLQTVALGSLSRLTIGGLMARCSYFLHHLDIPATASIEVAVECLGHSTDAIVAFCYELSSWLHTRHSFEPFAAKIAKYYDDGGSFDMTALAWRCGSNESVAEDADVNVSFEWDAGDLSELSERRLTYACYDIFATEQLNRFYIDGAPSNAWRDVVYRSPALAHVTVSDAVIFYLIDCEEYGIPHWDYFRELTTIELVVRRSGSSADPPRYLERLKDWLTERASFEVPLHQLIFKTDCTAADEWVADIQAAVPGLEVCVKKASL
ncbi:hypothetical protein FA95DRAFT_1683280 [Auriscalpium vulgare]|uniref:Uncharacterized protein n=1 Tax=Auriscalpium vulgare TaxID=40419 RepID=A0ACB8RCJ2_9AGAM|nr:hypothetical protein FA95DRAFT_1683280 [Auriscalpium vulgare]